MITLPKERLLVLVSGPSGVGKDTIMRQVTEKDAQTKWMPTAVTREPRTGEVDGVSYYFITKDAFLTHIGQGEILEYSEHYGNYYGTMLAPLQELMRNGFDAMTDLNWTGVAQIQERIPDNILKILLLPPSFEAIEARQAQRATETGKQPDPERMEKMREDFKHLNEPEYVFTNSDMIGSKLTDYDHVVVNDDLEQAVAEVYGYILAARKERQRP